MKQDERTPGLELLPVRLAQPWAGFSRLDIGPYKIGIAITNEDGDQDPEAAGAALENWVKVCNSFTSLREALAEGRQAAIELASLMREGAHHKKEIKWCKVVDKIDAALKGVPQPAKPEAEARIVTSHALPVTMWDSIATAVVKRVAELPDRSSPDNWPEAMLVTSEELHDIIMSEFDSEVG